MRKTRTTSLWGGQSAEERRRNQRLYDPQDLPSHPPRNGTLAQLQDRNYWYGNADQSSTETGDDA